MNPRIIALYLPQYHPIPENDKAWGPGFTEWVNVAKARSLCRGHIQPKLPADLGFYDLRHAEVRERQAELAREAGIEGFCYYHYWFGKGRQLLNQPFDEVLASGKPSLPFCLCWANHDWTNRSWTNASARGTDPMIMKMYYEREDHINHFYSVLPAFRDERYIRVDGKPLFAIWAPRKFPEIKAFIELWRELAIKEGLPGIHFVGYTANASKCIEGEKYNFYRTDMAGDYYRSVLDLGFDAVISSGFTRAMALHISRPMVMWNILTFTKWWLPTWFATLDYWKTMRHYYAPEDAWENVYPTIMPQWDRTPRAGRKTEFLIHATPEKFGKTIDLAMDKIREKTPEHQIIFLKAWNEWGEGNYVEPDQEFGHGWIKAIREALERAR